MGTPFWLSRDEVRELDRRASEEFGVPSIVLMENAGRGATELLMRLNPERQPVTILCGPGNNGGDGFVMARHLELHGLSVDVWLCAPSGENPSGIVRLGHHPRLSADAQTNYEIWRRSKRSIVKHIEVGSNRLPTRLLTDDVILRGGWLVDALFGTGLTRPLTSPYDEVVAAINASGNPVLAVDIPSGLDCDAGEPLGPTVKATHTATFVALKKGFLRPSATPWIGDVHVIDIGAPKKLLDEFRALRMGP